MTEEIKRLYRSRSDRMIFGVCGGLGEYFGIDTTIFRALFVLFSLFNGIGVLLYLFLAIIIPNKPVVNSIQQEKNFMAGEADEAGKKAEEIAGEIKLNIETKPGRRNMLGYFIVILGLAILTEQFFPQYLRWLSWQTIGALLVVYVGINLIVKK